MNRMRGTVIPLVLLLSVLAGCAPAPAVPPVETPAPSEPTATLQYIGHACFVLTASDGTRIAMDPYNSYAAPIEIQKFPADIAADLVTVSHFHGDHAGIKSITGQPRAMYQPGSDSIGIVQITGYKADHGLNNGVPFGDNTVFVFTIGRIKIVHMGGAGLITQPDILAAVENADVVIIDANDLPTHPAAEMTAQLRERNVRTVIPTHYSFTEKTRFYGNNTIDELIATLPPEETVVRESGSELAVTAGMPVQFLVLTPLALASQ
jgi:L-ascorbate metabolism protein UlaG (beta-lactamase superfamily)